MDDKELEEAKALKEKGLSYKELAVIYMTNAREMWKRLTGRGK